MNKSSGRHYLITASGERVEVSDAVYDTCRKSCRHENYLMEKDLKKKVQSIEQMADCSIFCDPGISDDSAFVERIVLRKFYLELLQGYLCSLTEEQRSFLSLLYEEEMSVTAASGQMGWSRRKGQYWKKQLLCRLRECFLQDGITDCSY